MAEGGYDTQLLDDDDCDYDERAVDDALGTGDAAIMAEMDADESSGGGSSSSAAETSSGGTNSRSSMGGRQWEADAR